MDNTDLRAEFRAVQAELESTLLERHDVIELALLALLIGQHLLLLGPPGTGKSMLVRALCDRIQGAIYFERLLTKFSTPEELFGPLSLSALENDRYERITANTLVEAHLAFVDEVFKANSSILNSMLGIMNERVFHEAGTARQVPLLSMFGASNELPEDSSLSALFDRFLLRTTVTNLVDDSNIKSLLDHQLAPVRETLSMAAIDRARGEVRLVELTDDAREAILAIKRELELEGIAASDRRWKLCASLVMAKAWLEGDTQAAADHCEVLTAALWSEPGHVRVVERVVSTVANPLNLEAVELLDAARDLYDARPKPDHPNLTEALEPILRQLADIHTRLEARIDKAPQRRTHRARQVRCQIERWHRELSTLALRSVSKLHMAPGAA